MLSLQVLDAAAAVLATHTVTEVEDGSQVVQQHQLSGDQLQANTEQAADDLEAQMVEPQLQHEGSTAVAEAQQAQHAESPVPLPQVGTASKCICTRRALSCCLQMLPVSSVLVTVSLIFSSVLASTAQFDSTHGLIAIVER